MHAPPPPGRVPQHLAEGLVGDGPLQGDAGPYVYVYIYIYIIHIYL